jgi:hypothetical protein
MEKRFCGEARRGGGMKHFIVWQVVRRCKLKLGCIGPMVFPFANFENEQDAIEVARLLDEEPMPSRLKTREHTVESLMLPCFESVQEFNDSR